MTDEPTTLGPEGADAALGEVERAQAAVRTGSRWTARYLGACGIASLIFVTLTGLFPGRGGTVTAFWVGVVGAAVYYARRQWVSWQGFRRLNDLAFAAWGLLWTGTAVLGFALFPGRPIFWVPAAFVVAAPLFTAAWRSARR